MLCIGSAGFVSNYYGGKLIVYTTAFETLTRVTGMAFPNRSDISSALGSFTVGFLGNLYGKFTRASSPFVVMVVGCALPCFT